MESGLTGEIGSYAVSRALEERRVDFELAPILRRDLEAGTAVEKDRKSVLAMKIHVQSTEGGQSGEHGNHVQYRVVVVFSCLSGLVPILLLLLEETTAKGTAFAQDPATNEDVLLTETGQCGASLPFAPFFVVAEDKTAPEHAPTHHRKTMENTVLERAVKYDPAILYHVQSTEDGHRSESGAHVL